MAPSTPLTTRQLFDVVHDRFNLEEFRMLCFDLGVRYDDLGGEGLRAKILDLVQLFERTHKLRELAEAVQAARPDLNLIPLNADKYPDAPTHQLFTLFIASPQSALLTSVLARVPVVSRLAELFLHTSQPPRPAASVGVAERNGSSELLRRELPDGVVLSTTQDPAALLSYAVGVAREMGRGGDATFRIGLSSDHVSGVPKGPDEIPDESVGLARRIAMLGSPGHVLASQLVFEHFEAEPGFKDLFRPLGKYEIKPHTHVVIYNVTDGETYGNPTPPVHRPPEQVLTKTRIPKRIRGTRTAKLSLTFASHLLYVRLKIELDTPQVKISCQGHVGQDCTFEFDFAGRGDSRKQTFEVGVSGGEVDALELLRIYSYDERGELLSPPVHGWVRLTPRPKPPAHFYDIIALFLWLADWVMGWPLYLRAGLPLAALALFLVFMPDELKANLSRHSEGALIRLGYLPPKIDSWEDEFDYESPQSARWIKSGEWSYPEKTWQAAPITQGWDPNDGAVIVRGEGIGVRKDTADEGGAFYDFDLEFQVKFLRGNTARWILRADTEERSWYLFELVNELSRITLRAYAVTPGEPLRELQNGQQSIAILGGCTADDSFSGLAQVRGNEFKFTFKLQPANEEDNRSALAEPLQAQPIKDKKSAFGYGNLGLLGRDDGNEFLVYFWRVFPPQDGVQVVEAGTQEEK
jgi:hypothetical protein